MLKTMSKEKTFFYLFLLVFGVFFRVVPHPANFTPLLALSLVGGLSFKQNYVSYLLPLLTLIISDFYLGFYPGFEFVYLGLLFCVLMGAINVSGIGELFVKFFASTFGFYIISNLGVWLSSGMYPLTFDGFIKCYTMAIPFYKATLLSTFVFLLLFSAVELLICSRSSWNELEIYGRQKR